MFLVITTSTNNEEEHLTALEGKDEIKIPADYEQAKEEQKREWKVNITFIFNVIDSKAKDHNSSTKKPFHLSSFTPFVSRFSLTPFAFNSFFEYAFHNQVREKLGAPVRNMALKIKTDLDKAEAKVWKQKSRQFDEAPEWDA